MKTNRLFQNPFHLLNQWFDSMSRQGRFQKPFGLKIKITLLILPIVAGVLFLTSYLDFQLSRKAQIDLYLDRNLYIAKQIDIGTLALIEKDGKLTILIPIDRPQAVNDLDKEKAALVQEGLRALIERESARHLARLGGTEPQLQPTIRRQSEPA